MIPDCLGVRGMEPLGAGTTRCFTVRVREVMSYLERAGPWAPCWYVGLFLAAAALMIWRLESLSRNGFGGTVLGTLIMPYCSGVGNLIFAFLVGFQQRNGSEVVVNCLVNNVTNLTLLLGLPALIWGVVVAADRGGGRSSRKAGTGKRRGDPSREDRLSLLLTLTAALFFGGCVWALGRDGKLDLGDGLVLVGCFLFWQAFHVFEVLKHQAREGRTMSVRLIVDLAMLLAGAYGVLLSTDWLVTYLNQGHGHWLGPRYLGWLSGWLMVMPNAVLAFYYGWRGRSEVVYASQVGDGHICIPLCLGVAALGGPVALPANFELGMGMVGGAVLLHAGAILVFKGLPRWLGGVLIAGYAAFVYYGLPR